MKLSKNKFIYAIGVVLVLCVVFYAVKSNLADDTLEGFIKGNGRIEATDVDISTKFAGRLENVFVNEGDFVTEGQSLAVMQLDTLEAQLNEANAGYQEAISAEASAKAQIAARVSDKVAAEAVIVQRQSELVAATSRLNRITDLVNKGAISAQDLDDQKASARSLEAAVATAKAQVTAAQSAIDAAKAQAVGASFKSNAAKATIARVEADIKDSKLVAPRAGRVQYRVAQPGEVLGAGGKILNLIDLSDVYMTFFIPEKAASRLRIGAEAHLIFDVAPNMVVPAKITFVASTAQFTPKMVETQDEREKLMFRVKAQLDRDLLLKHIELIKTGVPGVAWVKIDQDAKWPAHLEVNVSTK